MNGVASRLKHIERFKKKFTSKSAPFLYGSGCVNRRVIMCAPVVQNVRDGLIRYIYNICIYCIFNQCPYSI